MDKLKKVGLTALGTALVSTSAVAADYAVGGGAKLTLVGGDKSNEGNGWSMLDSITFRASSDLDNGMTVSMSQNLSAGAANNTHVTINMNEMGSIVFWKQGGTSVPGSWDDMLPATNEESWNGMTGTVGGAGAIIAAGSNADMFRYSVNVMDGLDFYASYSPSDGTAAVESSTSYGVQYTGVEGLTVSYAHGDSNSVGNTEDATVLKGSYAWGPITISYSDYEYDAAATTNDDDVTSYKLSYTVSDEISISYGTEDIDQGTKSSEYERLSVSYTAGGMTISASMSEATDMDGTTTATEDAEKWSLGASFAF